MASPRIYQAESFAIGDIVALNDDAFGHAIRVLRLGNNDEITLFNGQQHQDGFYQYQAKLCNVTKKRADVEIITASLINNESPLSIHLGQGISKGERMDFTLQKSVELGVHEITPLFTARCSVKLSGERLEKKRLQWQKIVISACEQSGRCYVPKVNQPMLLNDWLAQDNNDLKLNLHPKASHSIMSLPIETDAIRLLIGPEGGLNDAEILLANQAQFTDVLLGPRVLRTETAALTAITALQCRYGDLA